MNWKRWLFVALIAAGVVALILYGFRPQPVLVDAESVSRGPFRITVEEEGRTRLTDRYVISSPVSAFAPRLDMDVGDPIGQGQVVLRLQPLPSPVLDSRSRAEAEARVAAAEAAVSEVEERVRAAQADAAYWEGELARVKTLLESGDIPQERYDRTLTEHRRAEAMLESSQQALEVARAELRAARAVLEHSAANPGTNGGPPEIVEVRAPVAGRVMRVIHESQGVVAPGEPLLEIGDAKGLEVAVDVLSEDAVRIQPGMRVLLERWGGERPLEGRVRRVEPVGFTEISALGVEEQRVYVIVDLASPREEWKRLGAGYRVEAVFVLWESDDVLQVPASALFRHGEGWAVFTVEDGVARTRPVEPGRRAGLQAQILSGLSEGELVITHPDDSIENGTRVQVRGQQAD